MVDAPVTVVETPEFLAATRRLMDEDDRAILVDYMARNPGAGALVPESGGIRKLRWALQGRGKRGGARVIYFYHSATLPLFALTAYAKNEREDLTPAERADYRKLVKAIVETYGARTQRKK
jgi:hypothetical protein